MQVILRQDVEKVGLRGEVVDVAAGFARNYLLPRRLAEPAAPGRVAELAQVGTGPGGGAREARHGPRPARAAEFRAGAGARTEARGQRAPLRRPGRRDGHAL